MFCVRKEEQSNFTYETEEAAELHLVLNKMHKTESYHEKFSIEKRLAGICISIAIIATAVAVVLLFSGHLTTLPKDFAFIFQMKNIIPLVATGGGIVLFAGGVAYVIYHAINRQHPLLDNKPLGLFDSNNLEEVFITYSDADSEHVFAAYLDTSTLDENGDEKAYVYRIKPCTNHYGVSTEVCLATPIYMIGAVASNVIRFFIIPFAITYCLIRQKPTNHPTKQNYTWQDIPIEMGKSALRACKAPFYSTAYLIAALYSLFLPMNGRRLAFAIEYDWNEGVSLAEGIWTCEPQPLFRGLEWQDDAEIVRQNIGFSLAGCWHPEFVAIFKNGKAIHVYSIMNAVRLKKNINIKTGQYDNLYRRKDLKNLR